MVERSHKGLVLRDVTVKRGGKTFTQKRWVRPGEDEPKEKPSKKEEVKGIKGKFNIGDIISFMGSTLTIEKISEVEGTFKLSDGGVYTMGALDKFAKPINDSKETVIPIKDLKIRKKKPEKEIKRAIPSGTVITKENAEETVKVGSKINVGGKLATVIVNNNNSIIKYQFQDGEKKVDSVGWLIELGNFTTRESDAKDVTGDKERQKKVDLAEKKINDRHKQFDKVKKSKSIGAKVMPLKSPKVGDEITIKGKKVKIDEFDGDFFIIKNKFYDPIQVKGFIDIDNLVTGDKVSGNYKFTNNKEQDKKISETINKLDNLMLDGKSIEDSVKEVTGGKVKTIKNKVNLPDFDKSEIKDVKDTIKRISNYISPKYKESGLEINIVTNTTGRSYANSERNEISLTGLDLDSTLMHEVGHIMENNHGGNHKVCDDFLRSRTRNLTNPEKMNDLVPSAGYSDSEITAKDDFINPYIGKIYYKTDVSPEDVDTKDLRSSEILSMGMERFNNEASMRDFYRQDKEHFALTLSIMAGDFIE